MAILATTLSLGATATTLYSEDRATTAWVELVGATSSTAISGMTRLSERPREATPYTEAKATTPCLNKQGLIPLMVIGCSATLALIRSISPQPPPAVRPLL